MALFYSQFCFGIAFAGGGELRSYACGKSVIFIEMFE
jgi:hypothetical protein